MIKKNEIKMTKSDESKFWAFISYLSILCILPLLLKKDDKFAQYHAKQGLVLFIAEVIISIAGMVPIIGWFIIAPIGWIIILVLFIIGIVNALTDKTKSLPIIGKFAENLKI